MSSDTKARILGTLINQVKGQIDLTDMFPTREPGATEFVIEDPYAFLVASCLNRQTKADIIWTIPYDLRRAIGHLDADRIAAMRESELDTIIRGLPRKPRFVNDAAGTILELSRMIRNRFSSRAENMWKGRAPKAFEHNLSSIRGVGPAIASMATNLLIRRHEGVFSSDELCDVDIKPDVHTRRVLYRLGITNSEGSIKEAVEGARQLNPSFPGSIDGPLWWIGRTWCHASRPACNVCPMKQVCNYSQNRK